MPIYSLMSKVGRNERHDTNPTRQCTVSSQKLQKRVHLKNYKNYEKMRKKSDFVKMLRITNKINAQFLSNL